MSHAGQRGNPLYDRRFVSPLARPPVLAAMARTRYFDELAASPAPVDPAAVQARMLGRRFCVGSAMHDQHWRHPGCVSNHGWRTRHPLRDAAGRWDGAAVVGPPDQYGPDDARRLLRSEQSGQCAPESSPSSTIGGVAAECRAWQRRLRRGAHVGEDSRESVGPEPIVQRTI